LNESVVVDSGATLHASAATTRTPRQTSCRKQILPNWSTRIVRESKSF
jgi:hypothetical protein